MSYAAFRTIHYHYRQPCCIERYCVQEFSLNTCETTRTQITFVTEPVMARGGIAGRHIGTEIPLVITVSTLAHNCLNRGDIGRIIVGVPIDFPIDFVVFLVLNRWFFPDQGRSVKSN